MSLVAAQGREASFHFVAARKYFGRDVALVPCASFAEVLRRLDEDCSHGVVAIENSLSGLVHEIGEPQTSVQQLLQEAGVRVVDEVTLPIEQCLIALPGASLDDITAVYSHDAALKQCGRFLDEHLPGAARREHEDTAGAAADIKAWDDPHNAAIASREAARLHGLPVLAANIGDRSDNLTRFLVIVKH